jgi:peptide-methionine (S)-S-oxide reductase
MTTEHPDSGGGRSDDDGAGAEVAIFGGGCFWCTEAAFETVDGVLEVTPGYCGGHTVDPSYEEVCSGHTGHAEVVRLRFDPRRVRYAELLELFFKIHDPTQRDRQGADVGTQYRSAIFTTSDEQRAQAVEAIAALEASGRLAQSVVTEVRLAPAFYPAEAYHRGYFRNNPHAGYCQAVIAPKLRKAGLR